MQRLWQIAINGITINGVSMVIILLHTLYYIIQFYLIFFAHRFSATIKFDSPSGIIIF